MQRRDVLAAGAAMIVGLATRLEQAEAATSVLSIGGPGPNSGLPWHSGVARANGIQQFERWRGRKVDLVTIWGRRDTWSDIAGGEDDDSASGFFGGQWRGVAKSGRPLSISWPLLPKEADARKHDDSWPAAAHGEFDQYYAQFARKLQRMLEATGRRGCVVRVNWEGNGGFYPHSVGDQVDEWRTTFRRAVDLLRKHVPGVRIDWSSVKKGKAKRGNQALYPGSDWVDIVGVDYYDRLPANPTAESFDENSRIIYKGGPWGLRSWLDYAQSLGKPMSLPEWGVMTNQAKHGGAGGDNPVYMQKIHDLVSNNRGSIAYENYFDMDDAKISPEAEAPEAAAEYLRLWGASA